MTTGKQSQFILLEQNQFQELLERVARIEEAVSGKNPVQNVRNQHGFMSEGEAMRWLGKSKTWMYERRRAWERGDDDGLPYRKVGKSVYYAEEDLKHFITG